MAFLMLVDPLIRKPDAYTEQLHNEEENEVTEAAGSASPCAAPAAEQGPAPPRRSASPMRAGVWGGAGSGLSPALRVPASCTSPSLQHPLRGDCPMHLQVTQEVAPGSLQLSGIGQPPRRLWRVSPCYAARGGRGA